MWWGEVVPALIMSIRHPDLLQELEYQLLVPMGYRQPSQWLQQANNVAFQKKGHRCIFDKSLHQRIVIPKVYQPLHIWQLFFWDWISTRPLHTASGVARPNKGILSCSSCRVLNRKELLLRSMTAQLYGADPARETAPVLCHTIKGKYFITRFPASLITPINTRTTKKK